MGELSRIGDSVKRKDDKSRVKRADSLYKEGFRCSQALLLAICEELGLERDIALRMSTPFGGGMSHTGETCGAVIGALMIIGLKYGQTGADDIKAKEMTYDFGGEFVDKFKSRNGTILCRELLDCDISTPEGLRLIKEKRLLETVCPKFVQDAAEILEEILNYWDE